MPRVNTCQCFALCPRIVNVVLEPILWPLRAIKRIFETCVGYFLRAGVFMMGVYHNPLQARIIEWIKWAPCNEVRKDPFDPQRLKRSKKILEELGHRFNCPSIDGNAHLDYMLVRHSDVKSMIQQKGGTWEVIEGKKEVIFSQHPEDPDWEAFYTNVLCKMGWEEIKFTLNGKKHKGLLTSDQDFLKEKRLFLHCNRAGRSYGMNRKMVGRYLALHADTLLFDYRGTRNSTGVASEGGYYLDAETMFQQAKKYGYEDKNIWVLGGCIGGAVCAHLKSKFPKMGGLISEGTFDRLERVLQNLMWPANILAPFGMRQLQSNDPELNRAENGFNVAEKLKASGEKSGASVFIHVDNDHLVPEKSHNKLVKTAKKAFNTVENIIYNNPNPKKHGHTVPVFDDRSLWNRVVKVILESAR